MTASDKQGPKGSLDDALKGYCPVCGETVSWTPTSSLWPSKRLTQSGLPCHSGICSQCNSVLMFTVVSENPAAE